MNKENDNHVVITVEVEDGVIEKVRSGDITHIAMQLTEENQNLLLQNENGHLLLVVDEMPTTFHSCYLYNGGIFPYAIKDTLNFLALSGEEDSCLTRIIGMTAESGVRIKYHGADKPLVEDPMGDSCVWEIAFEVVPVPAEPRKYLMRWNPSISSFTEKDYEESFVQMENGMFRMNWSISEWEEARRGDFFYMLRVGDDKAGIVFKGQFISDPYPSEDWAGTTKRRMYVDLICMNPSKPHEMPEISLKQLEKSIPSYGWAKGRSGVLLPADIADLLVDI